MNHWERVLRVRTDGVRDRPPQLIGPTLMVRALPVRGLLYLRMWHAQNDLDDTCPEIPGVTLPSRPNTSSQSGATVLWQGPGRYLIITGLAELARLRAHAENALANTTFVLADVTDSWSAFDVTGKDAAELLAKLCAIDLHPATFGPNHCARTLLSRIPAILHRPGEEQRYEILVDRSFAQHAWDWLTDAAEEFLPAVRKA